MQCLDSDPTIIAAAPETPNTSNLQMPYVPSQDPKEFVAWANANNCFDPSRWSDRARLIPPTCMYRTKAVSEIGLADPLLYSMEFWDDDFSFRARRAGYRQLVCGGIACYHFGSVTGKEAQRKENTLAYGRGLFRQKNGIDPWGNGFCYDYHAIQLLRKYFPKKKALNVLGLDCGIGDTPLQIKNELRHMGRDCDIYQITAKKEYLPDQEPISREAVYARYLEDGVKSAFGSVQFDCAYLGRGLNEYEDISALLEAVARRLKPGACFVAFFDNPFFAPRLHALLQFAIPEDDGRFAALAPQQASEMISRVFPHMQIIKQQQEVEGIEQFIARHYGAVAQVKKSIPKLLTKRYYYVCSC